MCIKNHFCLIFNVNGTEMLWTRGSRPKKINVLIRIFSKSLQCQDWSKKRQSKAQMGNSCLQYRRHCSTTHRVRDGKMCIYMIVLIFNAEAMRLSFSSPGDKMIKLQQYIIIYMCSVLISKNLECRGQTACFILWPKVDVKHKGIWKHPPPSFPVLANK